MTPVDVSPVFISRVDEPLLKKNALWKNIRCICSLCYCYIVHEIEVSSYPKDNHSPEVLDANVDRRLGFGRLWEGGSKKSDVMASLSTSLARSALRVRAELWPVTCRWMATGSMEDPPSEKPKTPFYKRVLGFAKDSSADVEDKELEEQWQAEQEMLKAIEMERKAERLLRKQNKSRLHHSHRQMLRGLPPNVGLSMEWCERHTTREHKAELLGKFGRKSTGIDPSVAWPTKRQMQEQMEYERVFYNDLSFKQMLDIEQTKIRKTREDMLQRWEKGFQSLYAPTPSI